MILRYSSCGRGQGEALREADDMPCMKMAQPCCTRDDDPALTSSSRRPFDGYPPHILGIDPYGICMVVESDDGSSQASLGQRSPCSLSFPQYHDHQHDPALRLSGFARNPLLGGPAILALHPDLHEAADGLDGLGALLEDADLVHDAGAAELGDAQADVEHLGVLSLAEEVAVRVADEGGVGVGGGVVAEGAHQVVVDDAVDQHAVDRVVQVLEHVVVLPARPVVEVVHIVTASALPLGRQLEAQAGGRHRGCYDYYGPAAKLGDDRVLGVVRLLRQGSK
nr:hypothetical protein CFP56_11770 [Quercus suber]